jgi:ADP-heptose:LPS heptosyltransferase
MRPNRPRPLLTRGYHVPRKFDESLHHQLELWEHFFRHFGLVAPLDRAPLPRVGGPEYSGLPCIGLIPGSENAPEKRWPVSHWLGLAASIPDHRFVIFGTAADQPIASAIAAGVPPDRIENLAGRTDLPALAERLRACRLVVSNDSGGMHLANAVGTPVIGLFGALDDPSTSRLPAHRRRGPCRSSTRFGCSLSSNPRARPPRRFLTRTQPKCRFFP